MIGYMEWLIPAFLLILALWKGPDFVRNMASSLGSATGEYEKAKRESRKELEEMEEKE